MAVSREHVQSIVDIYLQAWETQDPDLILKVFTPDAVYHERVLGEPIRGHSGIRNYWTSKVVVGQARHDCRLLNLYLDGDTAIAEWEACFDDLEQAVRKRLREVALFDFRDGLIESLREYWASEVLGPIES